MVYPFNSRNGEDSYGWKFGEARPPSYSAFGRMRALLAVEDALRLKPDRMFEVAAGGGGLAAAVAGTGCEVLANDLRADQLAASLEEYATGKQVKIVAGNMFDLAPEEIGTFDLVIACEVIEHVAHPTELLVHLKRFLAPGGRLLLTTPNGRHFRNRLPTYAGIQDFTQLEKRQFMPDADGHLFLFTPRELRDLAKSLGYEVERLDVWGTPVLSGHGGLRHLAGRYCVKVAYGIETLTQRCPSFMRERFCVAMSVVLRVN